MKLLLDTHALLWWFVGDSRLSLAAREAMDEAESVCYSVVSLWEIGLKLGRAGFDFHLVEDWDVELPAMVARYGVRQEGIEARHCKLITQLAPHHGDPFDRMLIAQSLSEGWSVVGKDHRFDAYGVKRVW
ncbi:MAG: type II toxin-antitoxin system VapC family toxin [Verrucomicrobiota bacterium JB023]|nr:type II toxin-antitoxin system VapC family toxin [Verrucomicrobiota bacterium JB023]